MIRLFALDLVPFLLFVGLVTGTWIYDREGFLPSGLIYAILFLLYEKLNRIEFSLSEDMREALLLKTDHRFLYGLGKLSLAGLVAAGIFYNQERSWVDVETTLARFGLASGQAAVGPAEAERAGGAWRDGLEEKGSKAPVAGAEAERKPVEGARETTGLRTGAEPGTPEKAPERPETKAEAKDPAPEGADTTSRVEEQPGEAKQEPPKKIDEPRTPGRETETATLEPKAEPRSPSRGEAPPVSQFEFEED